jgi:hypothetical protein
MTESTERDTTIHAGHADLFREATDGLVGEGSPQ